MPLSGFAADQVFTIGSSVTALAGTSQMFTGATQDFKTGGPRAGYDLTTNLAAVFIAATNAGAAASVSQVLYTLIAEAADTTDFTSNLQQLVYPPIAMNFNLNPSSTGSVTQGARAGLRWSFAQRYGRVRIITPTGPGSSVSMITTKMEAIFGQATPP